MAENSKIEWTTHTWNPWRGCTKVSPGCKNCYAETLSGRNPGTLGVWGPNGTRVVASESMWREPLKWNREAECTCGWNDGDHAWDCPQADERPRVFCASLADVFEEWDKPMIAANGIPLAKIDSRPWTVRTNDDEPTVSMDDVRQRLFDLIAQTPNLDWLILTKRPNVMREWLRGPFMGAESTGNVHHGSWPWPNVWLGTTVEDQKAAKERIPILLDIPAAQHFLSCEPLLEEVDVSNWLYQYPTRHNGSPWPYGRVSWVIVGGESGPGARPCRVEWIRSIVEQCKAAGVPCFVKQLGAAASDEVNGIAGASLRVPEEAEDLVSLRLRDKKGGDIAEWPADLQVREFPRT